MDASVLHGEGNRTIVGGGGRKGPEREKRGGRNKVGSIRNWRSERGTKDQETNKKLVGGDDILGIATGGSHTPEKREAPRTQEEIDPVETTSSRGAWPWLRNGDTHP